MGRPPWGRDVDEYRAWNSPLQPVITRVVAMPPMLKLTATLMPIALLPLATTLTVEAY
jgi:hypothetical protein